MTVILITSLVFALLLFLITTLNVITAPMLNNGGKPQTIPQVSVLVPARNEEKKLAICLESLSKQNYPNFEIIVLNDQSTDQTQKIIDDFVSETNIIKGIVGIDVPEGWTGKNWACYNLSQNAVGEIFIFTDADNFFETDAVSKTVAWIQKYELDMLSAFPQQKTRTFGEKLIIPIVDMFVYSLLPLWLTLKSKKPSLAAANGQWIALKKSAYIKVGGHTAVKNKIVEDTELARTLKKRGFLTLTTSGAGIIYGKMYETFKEVFDGFSKNIFGLMNYALFPFLLFLFILLATFVVPFTTVFLSQFFYISILIILITVLLRFLLVLKFKHPFFESVILSPIGVLVITIIGINSIILKMKKNTIWKERKITF